MSCCAGASASSPAPRCAWASRRPSPLQQSLTSDMLDVASDDHSAHACTYACAMREYDGSSTPGPTALPTPRTSHRSALLHGPAPSHSARSAPLVGAYEQALLTARLSSGLHSLPFEAQLGVIGSDGMSASQIRVPFTARFHPGHDDDTCVKAPYIGKIDLARHYAGELHRAHRDAVHQLHQLDWNNRAEGTTTLSSSLPGRDHQRPPTALLSRSFDQPTPLPPPPQLALSAPPSFPGYRVPRTGRVQLVLRGPEAGLGAPRVLVVPYDVHTLSPGMQCIMRHTCYASPVTPFKSNCTLRYAVQLRFAAAPLPRRQRAVPGFGHCATPRVYLFGSIRLAFSPRLAGSGSLSHGSMYDGEQLFRSSHTWGLPAPAPAPEPVEPLEPLGAFDPLTALDELNPLRHAPPGSLKPDPGFALPPPVADADAFAFSGPGADWSRAVSRTRAAVRTLHERIWVRDTRPQLPGHPVSAGARPASDVSMPAPVRCPQLVPILRHDSQLPTEPTRSSLPSPPLCSVGSSRTGAQMATPQLGADTYVAPVPVDSDKLDQVRRREAQTGEPSAQGTAAG